MIQMICMIRSLIVFLKNPQNVCTIASQVKYAPGENRPNIHKNIVVSYLSMLACVRGVRVGFGKSFIG